MLPRREAFPSLPAAAATAAAAGDNAEEGDDYKDDNHHDDANGHAAEGVPCHRQAQLPIIVPRLHLHGLTPVILLLPAHDRWWTASHSAVLSPAPHPGSTTDRSELKSILPMLQQYPHRRAAHHPPAVWKLNSTAVFRPIRCCWGSLGDASTVS